MMGAMPGDSPAAGSCATPQAGCTCDAPGAQVPCGHTLRGDQNFIYCFEGVRTCLPSGVYGECAEGSVVTHALSTQVLRPMALAGSSTSCSGTVSGPLLACTNGRQRGEACTVNADCNPGRKKCSGSSDPTQDCRDDGDCNVACTRFNGECTGGPTPNIGCDANADCGAGGTCTLGGGGGSCGTYTGICDSNGDPTDGHECNANSECGPGQCRNDPRGSCIGGRRNGKHCRFNHQCRGGGTCSADQGGDGGAGAGAIDPCDPFCHVYSDTPIGFDAGAGWTLSDAGGLTPAPNCGNGVLDPGEPCDDGNLTSGDGCTNACQLEPNFYCPTAGAACVASNCGNGTVEGLEQCDDGNHLPYDGCSPACTWEADCPADLMSDGCNPRCGDGIKFPSEDCDDGNLTNGDGCSSTCVREPGSNCTTVTASAPASIDVPVVFRDFDPKTHWDFQKSGSGFLPHTLANPFSGAAALPGSPNCGGGLQKGLPGTTIGADKLPRLRATPEVTTAATTNCARNASSFLDWWHDSPRSTRIDGRVLRLFQQGAGTYVFNSNTDTVNANGVNCGKGTAGSSCSAQGDGGFFPINGLGYGNWTGSKNYHFTSEVRYPFTYNGGETLTFDGDDDVFVYVNNRLIVDLGGVRPSVSKSVTLANATPIDAPGAGNVNLTPGKTYEIAVFQTERNTTGSNYRLTLRGFNQTKSVCTPPAVAATLSRDFEATCRPNEKVVWQLFRWKALATGGQTIGFRAATADNVASLPANAFEASTVPVGTADVSNNPTVWAYDPTPVSQRLDTAGQQSKAWLRVFMTFNGTPSLLAWQQLYDCIPVE